MIHELVVSVLHMITSNQSFSCHRTKLCNKGFVFDEYIMHFCHEFAERK